MIVKIIPNMKWLLSTCSLTLPYLADLITSTHHPNSVCLFISTGHNISILYWMITSSNHPNGYMPWLLHFHGYLIWLLHIDGYLNIIMCLFVWMGHNISIGILTPCFLGSTKKFGVWRQMTIPSASACSGRLSLYILVIPVVNICVFSVF